MTKRRKQQGQMQRQQYTFERALARALNDSDSEAQQIEELKLALEYQTHRAENFRRRLLQSGMAQNAEVSGPAHSHLPVEISKVEFDRQGRVYTMMTGDGLMISHVYADHYAALRTEISQKAHTAHYAVFYDKERRDAALNRLTGEFLGWYERFRIFIDEYSYIEGEIETFLNHFHFQCLRYADMIRAALNDKNLEPLKQAALDPEQEPFAQLFAEIDQIKTRGRDRSDVLDWLIERADKYRNTQEKKPSWRETFEVLRDHLEMEPDTELTSALHYELECALQSQDDIDKLRRRMASGKSKRKKAPF